MDTHKGSELDELSRQAVDRAVRRLEAEEAADRARLKAEALFVATAALWAVNVLLALKLLRVL